MQNLQIRFAFSDPSGYITSSVKYQIRGIIQISKITKSWQRGGEHPREYL